MRYLFEMAQDCLGFVEQWDCKKLNPDTIQWVAMQCYQSWDLAPPEEKFIQILKALRLSTWQEDYSCYSNMQCHPQIGCMASTDIHIMNKQSSQEKQGAEKERLRLRVSKELKYDQDSESTNDDS